MQNRERLVTRPVRRQPSRTHHDPMDGEPEDANGNLIHDAIDTDIANFFSGGFGALDLNDDVLEHFFTNAEKENEFCKLIGCGAMRAAMSLWHNYGMHEDAQMMLAKLTEMLDASPELANCASDYDYRCMSALERAVELCQIPVVDILLSRGADPKNNKYEGELPTMASIHGNEEMAYMPNWAPHNPEVESAGRTIPGFPGLMALCDVTTEPPEEDIRMLAWLKSRHARNRLKMFRDAVRTRAIVVYWLGKAMETACAEGGTGRQADLGAWVAENQPREE
jgi:hypothetical protein